MRVDIVNGDVITGDGTTYQEASSIITEDGVITEILQHPYLPYIVGSNVVVNAHNGIVLPGLVNLHGHALGFGPVSPTASPEIPLSRMIANLDGHLLQGTTTIVNNDGFALPFENDAINKLHPLNIKATTLHTPKNVAIAERVRGHRLAEKYRNFTAEEAVAGGAVALGEVGAPGSGQGTLEKSQRTGRIITAPAARALNDAYLVNDEAALRAAMRLAGLDDVPLQAVRDLVRATSIDVIEAENEAIIEAIEYSPTLGVPVLCHADQNTHDSVVEAAKALGPRLLAEHANHTTTVESALTFAKAVKRYGSWVEITTGDSLVAKQLKPDPSIGFALLESGLVDTIGTDYIGGYYDSLLSYIKDAVRRKLASLPAMIRMCTRNPAEVIPGLPMKGRIEPGYVADIVIVDRNDISNVRTVIIGGRVVVHDGRRVA